MAILRCLPSEGGITANEVGNCIGKDRSTAHRGLEKMVSCGICFKEKRSGIPRGYANYYHRLATRELYKIAEAGLDKCYKNIKTALKNLDSLD